MEKWTRICPKCQRIIEHTLEHNRNKAEKNRLTCKSCSWTKERKETQSQRLSGKTRPLFTKEHRNNISEAHKNSEIFQAVMHSEEYRQLRAEIAVKNQTGLSYEEWLESKTERELYYVTVRRITRRQPIHLLENCNNRGSSGVEGAYHLDHIIPVSYGFKNNMPPEIIGDISNLQFIPWRENAIKGSNYEG